MKSDDLLPDEVWAQLDPRSGRSSRRARVLWLSLPVALVVIAAVGLLAARGSSAQTQATSLGTSVVSVPFTCCAAADIDRVWHPGETFTLHWIAPPRDPSGILTEPGELEASLTGPFADAAALKQDPTKGTALNAAPITVTSATTGDVVSTIAIPVDARPGLYDLRFTVVSGPSKFGGDSVVTVAAR